MNKRFQDRGERGEVPRRCGRLLRRLSVTVVGVVMIASCSSDTTPFVEPMSAQQVLEVEVVIGELREPLAKLSKGVLNLRLPDVQSRSVFAAEVAVNDLDGAKPLLEPGRQPGVRRGRWPATSAAEVVVRDDLDLWTALLDSVAFFHHFKLYSISGAFEGEDGSGFRARTGLRGLAQEPDGDLLGIHGEASLLWQRGKSAAAADEPGPWKLAQVTLYDVELTEAPRPLFGDVTSDALPKEFVDALATSERDEAVIGLTLAVRTGQMELEQAVGIVEAGSRDGSFEQGFNQVSVVDLDRDGYDDFYFTAFDGPAAFFRNRGDGTFEDITEELGLALEDVSTSLFADFDNDGDSDAFVSHWFREPGTRYLVNEGGRFVDRTSDVGVELPRWIWTISTADVDNDGLLDVYLGGYSNLYLPQMYVQLEEALANGEAVEERFPGLTDEQSQELIRRFRTTTSDLVSNTPGVPNLLLQNVGGGRFARAPGADAMEGWLSTLSSNWSDIDLDGDMDVYIVNEVGPNRMMRNEGGGQFVDISDAVTGEAGYGMGGAWGDYDGDGRQDMYTTNMYSKAGLRISDSMKSRDSIVRAAQGNTLMRNTSAGFVKTSGQQPPAIQVEAAEFGWGGAFADFDNDGALDLYVPAGFFSSPREVATVGDA